MSQYLFVSDAHGDRDILVQLFNHYRHQVTQIFYNGDSELRADDSLFTDVMTVAGNMDFDRSYQAENIYHGEQVVFQTHGHLYGVNFSLTKLVRAAKRADAQIITFGHTHQLGVEVVNDILVINPGSISQPRGQFASLKGTYALVTVTKTTYDVQYYNRQQEAIPNLHFSFNLK